MIQQLQDSYCELTGSEFQKENNYLLLSDMISCLNFIDNSGIIEYPVTSDVNMTTNVLQLGSEDNKISTSEEARLFVEAKIQTGRLKEILDELKSSDDLDVVKTGQQLGQILLNENEAIPEKTATSNKIS